MKQAMIFAAGLGTRLKPLTDKTPKALIQVGGMPLLKHVIAKLKSAGVAHIVVNVHHHAQQIVSYLENNGNFDIDIRISDETEQLLETGGGLKKAEKLFRDDSPIIIHNVDILDNIDYGWLSRQHLDSEDAVLVVSRRQTKRYLIFDKAMRLMGWTNIETGEIKSPYEWLRVPDDVSTDMENYTMTIRRGTADIEFSIFAFSGIHSFSPRLFRLMDRFPERFPIMDFYLQTCHRTNIYGCIKDDLQIVDVGKLDSLEKAEEFLDRQGKQ